MAIPASKTALCDPYPTVSRAQFESLKALDGEQFEALAFLRAFTHGWGNSTQHRRETSHSGPCGSAVDRRRDGARRSCPASTRGVCRGTAALRHSARQPIRLRPSPRQISRTLCSHPGFLPVCVRSGRDHHLPVPRRPSSKERSAPVSVPGREGAADSPDRRVRIAGSRQPRRFGVALVLRHRAVRQPVRRALDVRRSAKALPRLPEAACWLANPVRIGESSRILLEWHGTELMCLRGHGLLYVPEWPAIWSARQSWMALGPSWRGLFSAQRLGESDSHTPIPFLTRP